jgi:hypothetical protein
MLYSQLSTSAKERARHWYRSSLCHDEWWESTYETWKDKLRDLGFTDAEIQFRGFGSQGDGASFSAPIEREFKLPNDLATALTEAIAVAQVLSRFNGEHREVDLSWEISACIRRSPHSRYVHARTIDAEINLTLGRDVPEDLAARLENWARSLELSLTDEARALSDEIYRDLEAEWDHLNSDDRIEEDFQANDYHFDADGEFMPSPSKLL